MKTTLSNEALAIGAKNKITEITEIFIEAVRGYVDAGKQIPVDLQEKYCKALKDNIGINATIKIYDLGDHFDAGVMASMAAIGHNSIYYYASDSNRHDPKLKDPTKYELEVDLKAVTVKGSMVEHFKFAFQYSYSIFATKSGFTIRELTALFMHETGHAVDALVTLGDYVWLNYYLTDGIEILQGKKKNTFKVEILDEQWLLKNVPEDMRNDFMHNRDEDIIKRAILTTYRKAPRHHIHNNPVTSMRRLEQSPDLFASRLGYGRDLVTALSKWNKRYDDYYLKENRFFANVLGAALMIVFAPITALVVLTSSEVNEYDFGARYDNSYERLNKIRKDLVAQLKDRNPDLNKEQIAADIEAVDDVLKAYTNNRSITETLLRLFQTSRRREQDYTQAEEDLEDLFNNNLFVQAYKLENLKGI